MNPEEASILDDILFMKKKADDILIRKSHDREDFECSCGWSCDPLEQLLDVHTACPDCGRELEDY